MLLGYLGSYMWYRYENSGAIDCESGVYPVIYVNTESITGRLQCILFMPCLLVDELITDRRCRYVASAK